MSLESRIAQAERRIIGLQEDLRRTETHLGLVSLWCGLLMAMIIGLALVK